MKTVVEIKNRSPECPEKKHALRLEDLVEGLSQKAPQLERDEACERKMAKRGGI